MPNHRLARTRAIATALSGAAFSLWGTGVTGAPNPTCPASLEVAETPGPVADGFHAFANGDPPVQALGRPAAHRLDTIMFSDGPPTEMAWLAPSGGGKNAQRWDFAPGRGGATWLSCGYLATGVIVSIPLPAATRTCRVTYDPATSPPTAVGLACR